MKASWKKRKWRCLISMAAAVAGCAGKALPDREPVDYVNPNIGTIGHLLVATSPDVFLPEGAVRLAPYTTPGITDKYLADRIFGFPVRESSHRRSRVTALLMATTGKVQAEAEACASRFDHDFETATPYYYAVNLEDSGIRAELTVTAHAAYYRFTFPAGQASNLLLRLEKDSAIRVAGDRSVEGEEPARSGRAFFHAEFSKPFAAFGTWQGTRVFPGSPSQKGDAIGAFASYSTAEGEAIEVKIGVSTESREQALAFLRQEIPQWDFESAKLQAREAWNRSLRILEVEGGTEPERIKFYTALYRVGGGEELLRRMGFQKDHLLQEARRYAARRRDELIPSSHAPGVMFQHGRLVAISDAYRRGLRDFDVPAAYANMKAEFMESTKIPWARGPVTELDRFYLVNGFFPALPPGQKEWVPEVHSFEKRQCVTITLQAAYESWCLARMARDLGREEDFQEFRRHAFDYRNVFHAATGFMAPKTADGKWVEPFDPKWSGGLGGRDYFSEMNSWTYTWYVPHDVEGLIRLMGGRENFQQRLDAVFVEQYDRPDAKYQFLGQFPDETGLIGQYAHGNEFSRHIPYLYVYAGAPWKTQRKVREILALWYGTGPLGICGDEDSGLMSLWYVCSATGLYPSFIVLPNYPVWLITSPLFEKTRLRLPGGEVLTVEARNASARNKYIQSARFNGAVQDKPWLENSRLERGGVLALEMGPGPNKSWGSSPEAAPPSFSNEAAFRQPER